MDGYILYQKKQTSIKVNLLLYNLWQIHSKIEKNVLPTLASSANI